MTEPRDLRVTDNEREHVLALLHKAMALGLISPDEFGARSDTAQAAKTRAELNAVVADVPGVVHSDLVPEQRLELRSVMSKIRRRGQWLVPSELVIRCDQSACELDFLIAKIAHDTVRIEFDVRAAHVKLLLPYESRLDVSRLEVLNCRYANKVRPERMPGPKFVLSGRVRGGSLTISKPMAVQLGSLMVRFPLRIEKIGD